MADYFTQSNTLVKKYRDYLQQSGEEDDRPDTELTVELGNYWRDQGTFDDRVAQDPEFREQYLKATQATDRSLVGEVGAGLSRAGRGLAGLGLEAAAFGADVVGADDTAAEWSQKGKDVAASGGRKVAPTVREFGDIRSVEGAVRYGLGKIGEAVPSLGEAVGTAVIGGAVAGPAGAVTGFVGKQAIKQMIKSGLAKRLLAKEIAGEVTEEGVKAALKTGTNTALKEAFAKQAYNTAARWGQGATGALNAYALSTAETYGATGDPGLSAVAGMVAAIPDTILPTYVAGKFLRGPATAEAIKKAGGYWDRFFKEAVKTVPGEMGTEAFQELVGIAAEKYHEGKDITLTDADLKRMREAAVGGAAGGAIAAPIAAAPSLKALPTEEQIEARRRAATAPAVYGPPAPAAPVTPPAPVTPRVTPPALMTPEQQDLRHAALAQLKANGTISPAETAEMGVLEALVSQRAPGVARTVTPPPPAVVTPPVTPPVPAAEVPALPTPPAPPPPPAAPAPVTPAPLVKPPAPPTSVQLTQNVRKIGTQLVRLKNRVPTLDVTEASATLADITKNGASPERVANLQASYAALEQASVAEEARLADVKLKAATEKQNARAAKVLADQQKAQAKEAERLAKEVEKAAKKLPAETVVPPVEVVTPPVTPPVDLEVMSDEPLKTALGAALPPPVVPFGAGRIVAEGGSVVDFVGLARGIKERADQAITEEDKAKLGAFDYSKAIDDLLKAHKKAKKGFFYSHSSGQSNTRTGVAMLMPDGRVIMAGLMPKRSAIRAGSTQEATGPAVQNMSVRTRDKAAGTETAHIQIGGNKPALLEDLVAWGARPFEAVAFQMTPGKIYQEFPSLEAYNAAANASGRAEGLSVRSVTTEEGVAPATEEETPVTQVERMEAAAEPPPLAPGTETPEAIEARRALAAEQTVKHFLEVEETGKNFANALRRGMTKYENATRAFESLGRIGREALTTELTNKGVTRADVEAYLSKQQPVVTAPPAPKLSDVETKLYAKIADLQADLAATTELEAQEEITAQIDLLMEKARKAATRQRETADPQQKLGHLVMRRQQFAALLTRLSDHNFDIEVLQAELGMEGGRIVGEGDEATIVLAVEDVTNGNLRNVVDLIHEVGHIEADKLDPGKRELVERAVDATIETVQSGKLIDPATNADLNWEEQLVETMAIKLGEEGFGTESAGLATSLIRAVKDMYFRVGMAMMKAFGVEPSSERVLAWFENNMRRRLGGDYDFAYIDLFSHLVEKATDRVTRFLAVDGLLVPDLVDPLAGLIRAEVLPDSVEAVTWNLNRFREVERPDLEAIAEVRNAEGQLLAPNGQPSKLSPRQWKIVRTDAFREWFGDWDGDPETHAAKLDENGEPQAKLRYRNSDESIGAELGMEYTEADARTQAAAWAEVMPILAEFKNEFKDMTPAEFWKAFGGKGDPPTTLIDLLETRVPGSTSARIDGEKMTEDMNQNARYLAMRLFTALNWVNRRRASAEQERITDTSEKMVEEAEQLNRIIREVRDADAQNSVFNENLLTTIKELAADLDRGIETGELAGALKQAIKQAENLTAKEAIPREYQTVFKQLLDAGGTSVFDYMSAIAKLDLPLDRATIPEVMKAITDNAPADSRLAELVKKRPLLLALSSLARNSSRQMNLLQLRLMKDSAEYIATKQELDEIRTAGPARIDALHEQIEAKVGGSTLRERLKEDLVKAKRKFNRSQRSIQQAQEMSMARERFADAMAAKATALAPKVGAFSYWEAHDGATYHAMQQDAQGNWTAVERTLKMVGTEIAEQHTQVTHDLALNRLFLNTEKSRTGTPLYNSVKRQTRELGKLDLFKNYDAATTMFLSKMLAPLAQKFGGVGEITGKRIEQMMLARENVLFLHRDDVVPSARRWNKALQEVAKAAGFPNSTHFFEVVANDVLYRLDTGGLGLTESDALRVARKAALHRIPKNYTVADNFGEKMDKLILAHKETSELMNRIKEESGLYVKDPRVRDPLTGKGNLQRHAIKYGFVTAPRKLNAAVVQTLVTTMRQLGWSSDVFKGLKPEEAAAATTKFFTPEVAQIFVDPFVRKPGKEVFFGAKDADGRNAYVSQIEAQQAWEKAGGNVQQFIEVLFNQTNAIRNEDGTLNRDGLGAYQVEMLKRFTELFAMESNLAEKSSKQPESNDPFGNKAHRIMDARTNELIPPEHFKYEMFTELDAMSHLNEIAFHSAFGRDGTDLDTSLTALIDALAKKSRHFLELPTLKVKDRRAFAAEKGWDYDEIVRAHEDLKNVKDWKNKVVTYFTGQFGSLGDARVGLELAQFNMAMVMNTPKSGLMNFLQVMDYPLIYRGLGKTAVKASTTATIEFARGIVGSIFTNFANEAKRVTEHDHQIGQLVEKRKTSQLPLSMLRSDIGAGGRFDQGGIANRLTQGLRSIRSQMQKSVGKGGFLPVAPFAWISHKVDIAIATANVQALESIVKRAMDFYRDHPEHNTPSYRLTAADLGMDKGGWFTDEGAFKYFRERVNAYGMGSLESLAHEAMPRVADGGTMLTREQAALTAMMALDEVSLQANINTRPDWMVTNPIGRLGGLMLGWPLARINTVNKAFADPDGKLTLASAMRAAGVMAAWSIPMGLAYSLLIDEYDDKILNKKSNLRRLDPITLTPVVGPLLAVLDQPKNLYALTERLGRMGTYGLAGDLINSIVNTVDPTSGQRDFDLNSRILVYSQYANIRDVFRNFIHQDFEYTYASVGRPLITSLGGNSLFQAMQVINNVTGLTNAEQAITNRISVGGYLRSAGRDAGIELRSGARSSPTAQSVWYQQMVLTAMANDRVGFAEAYRQAVEVARKSGEDDPEAVVLQGFKARHPLNSIYAGKPTDLQMRSAYRAMPDEGKRAVAESLRLFENYTDLISPNPITQRMKQQMKAQVRAMQPPTIEQLRRRAASGALAY